jgi:hypothetical protein
MFMASMGWLVFLSYVCSMVAFLSVATSLYFFLFTATSALASALISAQDFFFLGRDSTYV